MAEDFAPASDFENGVGCSLSFHCHLFLRGPIRKPKGLRLRGCRIFAVDTNAPSRTATSHILCEGVKEFEKRFFRPGSGFLLLFARAAAFSVTLSRGVRSWRGITHHRDAKVPETPLEDADIALNDGGAERGGEWESGCEDAERGGQVRGVSRVAYARSRGMDCGWEGGDGGEAE
jgi:hypothetical protein